MGKVIIQDKTTKDPITLMGFEAGTCWGADTSDPLKNYNRGLGCVVADHGRLLEFPQIYMNINDYSVRFGREFYTHIGAAPSRLQSSTRRIDYSKGFDYVLPPSIKANPEAEAVFTDAINTLQRSMNKLIKMDIPIEDATTLYPLAGYSNIVCRTDLRMMVDMAHQRKCTLAYWEYRGFFKDFEEALKEYSEEWRTLVEDYHIFKRKCEVFKMCPEKGGCGYYDRLIGKE